MQSLPLSAVPTYALAQALAQVLGLDAALGCHGEDPVCGRVDEA